MTDMAIVKATYTKSSGGAKASIRYIEHRPGKDNAKINRILFGMDGAMGRWEAYRMIDEAEKGSLFFRFVISPDPKQEDIERDLFLREITEQTMLRLEDRVQSEVQWVAAIHDDHAPHRHVHVVAVVPGRLHVPDFQALRQTATEACLEQRTQRDLMQEHQRGKGEGIQWERGL
jgi:hypothetical protein